MPRAVPIASIVSIHAPVRVRPEHVTTQQGHGCFNPRTREGATVLLNLITFV